MSRRLIVSQADCFLFSGVSAENKIKKKLSALCVSAVKK
jgi:hypothetical protein